MGLETTRFPAGSHLEFKVQAWCLGIKGSSTRIVTSCDNIERPHIVWGRIRQLFGKGD
ncbi:hypothetical protein GCM10011389_26380 [Pontibacillus salipaludis]|uniref:Uncharacterized protein n=1 Tax=Pontibacillus salipaludis TaxID=1697394 RepID=A0ABQ1Q810_9BACI|nr:hypothetical protein GCM10011389_26380 [Pontibacillus salipaludis]